MESITRKGTKGKHATHSLTQYFQIPIRSNNFEILPGCRCIRFATTFGKEWGAFVSPDFPGEYQRGNEATGEHAPSPQRGIPCLLYLFSGTGDNL